MHYLCNLLTYSHQICTTGASDVDAPTKRFIPSLTTFRGNMGQNVKIKFSDSYGGTNRNHCTDTYYLSCTDLLTNPHRTEKPRSIWPTLRSKSPAEKKWGWMGILASWAYRSPWNACYILLLLIRLLRPGRGAEYCDQFICLSVCLSVCPRAYLWNRWTDFHEMFYAWLGPPLAALQYIMYFRFWGWRHVWP